MKRKILPLILLLSCVAVTSCNKESSTSPDIYPSDSISGIFTGDFQDKEKGLEIGKNYQLSIRKISNQWIEIKAEDLPFLRMKLEKAKSGERTFLNAEPSDWVFYYDDRSKEMSLYNKDLQTTFDGRKIEK